MLKKVFIIIILPFAFYSCSSIPTTRNSTVVLYLSHNIEGPIYIPRADSGKKYDKPVDNTKSSSSKTSKKEKTKRILAKDRIKPILLKLITVIKLEKPMEEERCLF